MKEKKIDSIKKPIVDVLKKRGVKRAGIFGSYARGEENKRSDIDILIEPVKGMSLLDIVMLELLLKKILKRKIDLLTYNGISPYLKENILAEEVRII
jgi:uncharacterized protein